MKTVKILNVVGLCLMAFGVIMEISRANGYEVKYHYFVALYYVSVILLLGASLIDYTNRYLLAALIYNRLTELKPDEPDRKFIKDTIIHRVFCLLMVSILAVTGVVCCMNFYCMMQYEPLVVKGQILFALLVSSALTGCLYALVGFKLKRLN